MVFLAVNAKFGCTLGQPGKRLNQDIGTLVGINLADKGKSYGGSLGAGRLGGTGTVNAEMADLNGNRKAIVKVCLTQKLGRGDDRQIILVLFLENFRTVLEVGDQGFDIRVLERRQLPEIIQSECIELEPGELPQPSVQPVLTLELDFIFQATSQAIR